MLLRRFKGGVLIASVFAGSLALQGCFALGLGLGIGVAVAQDPPQSSKRERDVEVSSTPTITVEVCELGQLERCTARCTEGNSQSCNNLGAMYELGDSVHRDSDRALDLYDRACAAGADAGCTNATRLRAARPAGPVELPYEPDPAPSEGT